MLVSHGRDGKGAYTEQGAMVEACGATAKDAENCDGDDVFLDSRFNMGGVLANYYDDLVLWKTQQNVDKKESPLVTLSSESSHTCTIKNDGTVWCWGRNDNCAQLGDGTWINRNAPVRAVGITDVITIAASAEPGTWALKKDGTAWRWGINFSSIPVQDTTISALIGVVISM